MKQAYRPDERPTLMEALAALGYLVGLTVVAGLLIFGLPLALSLIWRPLVAQ